jgi:hypothetical protein
VGLMQRMHSMFHKLTEFSRRFEDYFTNSSQLVLKENNAPIHTENHVGNGLAIQKLAYEKLTRKPT